MACQSRSNAALALRSACETFTRRSVDPASPSPSPWLVFCRPIGRTITLTGPGADMTVTNITINGDPLLIPVQSNPNWERFRIADPQGIFLFRVGGTLNVNAGQLPGVYTGTFDIRLDYQ